MNRPDAQGQGRGLGFHGVLRDLDLSSEQQSKIQEIFKNRPADPFEAVKEILTPEQVKKFDELKSEAPVRGRSGEPAPGRGERRCGFNGRSMEF
jgi:Spy/CpxP family protein refolding chaperone